MFETITFWIIVAWFFAGLWMILGSFGGPATAARGRPPAAANGSSDVA